MRRREFLNENAAEQGPIAQAENDARRPTLVTRAQHLFIDVMHKVCIQGYISERPCKSKNSHYNCYAKEMPSDGERKKSESDEPYPHLNSDPG